MVRRLGPKQPGEFPFGFDARKSWTLSSSKQVLWPSERDHRRMLVEAGILATFGVHSLVNSLRRTHQHASQPPHQRLEEQDDGQAPLGEEQEDGAPICAICLDTEDDDDETPARERLPCGHEFHRACIHRMRASDGGASRCPLCRAPCSGCAAAAPRRPAEAAAAACRGGWTAIRDVFEQHSATSEIDVATARRLNLRHCPACRTAIERVAGCRHMRCRCGRAFDWDHADRVGHPWDRATRTAMRIACAGGAVLGAYCLGVDGALVVLKFAWHAVSLLAKLAITVAAIVGSRLLRLPWESQCVMVGAAWLWMF